MVVEKWRYECPECGSRQIRERSDGMNGFKEVPDNRMMNPHFGREDVADYYCKACQTPIDDPIDMKSRATNR